MTTVVLITGALTGIGRATAWLSLRRARGLSCPAVATRRDMPDPGTAQPRREAEFIRADVRDEDDVRNLIDKPWHGSAGSMSPSTMRDRR